MQIDIHQLQATIRDEVRQVLLPYYNQVSRQYKTDGSVVTVADKEVQQHLTQVLTQWCPDIALLGEEMSRDHQQALINSGQALWCLDPIDGTSNFASGMPCFCVSLALIVDGKAEYGIVYDPIMDESFYAEAGRGAWLNGKQLQQEKSDLDLSQTLAFVDFKRLETGLAHRLLDNRPFCSHRSIGSTALELCWLAADRVHLYLRAKQHLWDFAAANLILQEAGGYSCTLDGEPLSYDSLEPKSACAASDPRLFKAWTDYLAVSPQSKRHVD
jgi:myo-inositol-1(or 4)-monophosphatase